MLKLETDKGLTYYNCSITTALDGSAVIMLPDKRLVSVIAAEFEGINHMVFTDTEREIPLQKEYNGYSVLWSIIRIKSSIAQISLVKPTGGD